MRSAVDGDLPAIAEVAVASGLGERDSGRDPTYVRHLLGRGTVVVAETAAGSAIGFAGAIPVGSRWMLTDLFVRPDRQNSGVGFQLLRAAIGDVTSWMTFSSTDLRAVGLYLRVGASPRWPLLYLRGQVQETQAPADLHPERVSPDEAAGAEAGFTGIDRTADYRYWAAAAAGAAYVIRHGDDVVAAGCVRRNRPDGSVAHFTVAPNQPPTPPVLCLLAVLDAPATICLPAPHPATRLLLEHGFRIDGYDLFMISGVPCLAEHRAAYAPGLF